MLTLKRIKHRAFGYNCVIRYNSYRPIVQVCLSPIFLNMAASSCCKTHNITLLCYLLVQCNKIILQRKEKESLLLKEKNKLGKRMPSTLYLQLSICIMCCWCWIICCRITPVSLARYRWSQHPRSCQGLKDS